MTSQVGDVLLDFNGQNSSQELRDSDAQIRLLDGVGGLSPLAAALESKVRRLREIRGHLDNFAELSDEARGKGEGGWKNCFWFFNKE